MKKENNKFDAEVGKVLNLVINSIYTNKDIFLRELISNAADACEKLRYLAIQNPELLKTGAAAYNINVHLDIPNKTITISDKGIGMDDTDMKENLGTIASSGTQKFLEKLQNKNDKSNLIGQFGVGFYSSFMVSNHVEVISVKAGTDKAYKWESDGKDTYTISSATKDFDRGTQIKLSMTDSDFLNAFKLKQIIKDYSNHIAFPITFSEINDKGEGVKPYQVNDNQAIWHKSKKDITADEYSKFYQSLSFAADTPYLTLHNKIEGSIEFINLIFVPSSKPYNLFHPERKSRLKLYVKKVFIADENINLVPKYLRFLQGVVDCDDLPLNISRESLQSNPILNKIRSNITKRIISELQNKKKTDREGYEKFWNNFGAAIKEGLCEQGDIVTHQDISDLCLFYSVSESRMISLEEYTKNMKPDQKHIYYFIGDSIEQMKHSPYLENFTANNIDVLLLTDHVDDFWVNVVSKYKDKEYQSITRSNVKLDTQEKSKEEKGTDHSKNEKAVCDYFKGVLGDRISDVIISSKLSSSPVCLTTQDGFDMRMERFLLEQNQIKNKSGKILEINIKHPVIQHINGKLNDESNDLIEMLFGQALIVSGEKITDYAKYLSAASNVMNKAITK